jgi:hypothetical protein
VQDVSGNGIDLIGGQRLRRVERHRAPHIIEERRGVRPEAADRRDRRCLVRVPNPPTSRSKPPTAPSTRRPSPLSP